MRSVHRQARIPVSEVYVGHLQGLRKVLQFAMPVGDADRAHMVALGKEQFQYLPPILAEPLTVQRHFHAFFHARDAGGKQLVDTLDLHQAEAAGAHAGKARQVAERGNVHIVFPRHLEDGLIAPRADVAPIHVQM